MPDKLNPVTNAPMAPLASVFGNEKNTPHSAYATGTAIAQAEGKTAGAPRPNDMAIECPTCKNGIRIFGMHGRGYYCLNSHEWKDLEQLMALNPRKLEFKGHKTVQSGYRELRLEMPSSTLDELQTKFGQKLPNTVAAVLDIINGPYLFVTEQDLKRITERTGVEIKSAAQLVGVLYDLKERARLAEEESANLRNRNTAVTGKKMADTELPIDFEDTFERVVALAAGREESVQIMLLAYIREGLENGGL